MALSPRQLMIVGLAVGLALLPLVPVLGVVAVPVQLLNTHIHELCHAVAAYLTGGSVAYIRVEADRSGVTLLSTAFPAVTASAGYVGASVVGALMVAAARTARGAKFALIGMAGCLAFSTIFWVRGSAVGLGVGVLWIGLLVLAARYLQGETLAGTAQVIGLMQCCASIEGVLILFLLAGHGQDTGDAANMQAITGVPAALWMLLWAALSIALAWTSVRSAWRAGSAPAGPSG